MENVQVMGSCQRNRTLPGFPADRGVPPELPWWCNFPMSDKVEPGDRGLHECCCTESIGCKGCCHGALEPEKAGVEMNAFTGPVDEEDEEEEEDGKCSSRLKGLGNRRQGAEKREFPPPLRWMAGICGQRVGFMRSERKDGRLVMTEVQTGPPWALLAFRECGRFRLHLIRWDGFDEWPKEAKPEKEEEEELTKEEILSEGISFTSEDEKEEVAAAAVDRWGLARGEGGRKCEEAVSASPKSPTSPTSPKSPTEWWMPRHHPQESPTAWWSSTPRSFCLTPA